LQMPIGHMEGNYFCDAETLAALKAEDRIAFRYTTPEGAVTAKANPNGALDNIAGVLNAGRNVLGMMPHPDRSSEALLGSADGLLLFQAMAESLAAAQ
jgi:phosphoribosylformylglycinamidine (FGAM) synthase-like amidotransferase family enzyme